MSSAHHTDDSTSDQPGHALKQRLQRGEAVLGAWCGLDSVASLEAMTHLAFDWILIDCEHGLTAAENCLPQIQAADRRGKAVWVRVPRLDPALIGRVLDAGAHGVMVPKVNSPAEAAAVIEACRYPPAGQRGVGPHRSSQYFTNVRDALMCSNDRVLIAIQIESRDAVESIDAILETPGLDVAFIGPADLSASLGHFGNPQHEDVEAAISHVLERARRAKVAAGIHCNDGAAASERLQQGFQMVNAANDLGTLVSGMAQQLERARRTEREP